MRNRTLSWIALLLVALALPALAAGEWRTARLLVVPGRSAGPLRLGEPLSPEAFRVLGAATWQQAPEPGPDGMDTGSVTWGGEAQTELTHGVNVKLNDGKGDDNVFTVYLVAVRAITDRGAYLGCTLRRARQVYPEARLLGEEELRDYSAGLEIPGLVMLFHEGRLEEMVVLPRL